MKKILYAGLIAALFVACHKDFDNTTVTQAGPIPTANVQASLYGRVIDESGHAISGAQVQVAGQTLTTNADGLFFVPNRQLDQNGTYVHATAAGYFAGARFAYPNQGTSTYLEMTLLTKNAVSFSTANNTVYMLPDGSGVEIPQSSLVTADGQFYSGAYKIAMRWLDPSQAKTFQTMPGDLRAQDSTGVAKVLKTYGMLAVELSTPGGAPLQIAPGLKAKVTFAIPASMQASAPAVISLWHFNEGNGYWEEDGQATRNGNQFVGEVSHFSFWNCDQPSDFVLLKGCLGDATGMPMGNLRVRLTSANFGSAEAITDIVGLFGGLVPRDETLELSVLDDCGNVVYSGNIGPFSDNTTLPKINVPINPNLTLTGNLVDCNSAPLSAGQVCLFDQSNNVLATLFTDANGHFEGNLYICNSLTGLTLKAFDAEHPLESGTQALTVVNGVANTGTLPVCTALDQYAILVLDGQTHIYSLFPQMTSYYLSAAAASNDSVSVALSFSNYNNLTATVETFNASYASNGQVVYFGCGYCTNLGCNCQPSDAAPLTFTSYPAAIGQYAVGSTSGSVREFSTGNLVPFTLTFRLKKTQ